MLNNYLRYDVYKALRSGVVNRGSYERYALNNGVIAELYLLSMQMPKLITFTSDDCIISLQGELKELKNNYGVLADSNTANRYSTIIRNADTGLAYLVSVGWPEDL